MFFKLLWWTSNNVSDTLHKLLLQSGLTVKNSQPGSATEQANHKDRNQKHANEQASKVSEKQTFSNNPIASS